MVLYHYFMRPSSQNEPRLRNFFIFWKKFFARAYNIILKSEAVASLFCSFTHIIEYFAFLIQFLHIRN